MFFFFLRSLSGARKYWRSARGAASASWPWSTAHHARPPSRPTPTSNCGESTVTRTEESSWDPRSGSGRCTRSSSPRSPSLVSRLLINFEELYRPSSSIALHSLFILRLLIRTSISWKQLHFLWKKKLSCFSKKSISAFPPFLPALNNISIFISGFQIRYEPSFRSDRKSILEKPVVHMPDSFSVDRPSFIISNFG